MISSKFDRSLSYNVAIYARMSSDRQNERSTAQQIDQINDGLRRNSLTWTVANTYVDSGISGRTERERPAYQEMMRDIRVGRHVVDLILVDSMSRLGRNEQMPITRQMLRSRYGVLILTADTQFEDPTTETGIVSSAFRELSAHTDNRHKSRDVSRGKADAVKLGFWPGGPAPFGPRDRSAFLSALDQAIVRLKRAARA